MTKELKKGFFEIEDTEYHQIKAVSNSLLKIVHKKSELHALTWLMDETPVSKIKQANFDFGTAWHLMVFQPHLFDKNIVEDNPANKNSNKYKEWRAGVPIGKLVLKATDIGNIRAMRKALDRKKSVRRILEAGGHAERAGFFQDPTTGVWIKIKPDWIFKESQLGPMAICDGKTSTPDALADFDKTIANYDYHFQAYLYLTGAKIITGTEHKEFYWIVQEKEPPYEARVFVADDSMLLQARNEVHDALHQWADAIKNDVWEGYPDIINFAFLPTWRQGIY